MWKDASHLRMSQRNSNGGGRKQSRFRSKYCKSRTGFAYRLDMGREKERNEGVQPERISKGEDHQRARLVRMAGVQKTCYAGSLLEV